MDKKNKALIDLSYLQEVSSDNVEFIVEMIDIFLEQTPEHVAFLSEVIVAKHWEKIAEMSHKIKPTLAFMGANEAKNTMAQIEHRARAKEEYEQIVADFKNLREDFSEIFKELEEKKKELLAKG